MWRSGQPGQRNSYDEEWRYHAETKYYRVRATDCDKAWDDMLCVIGAIGWGEVYDTLARFPTEVAEKHGQYVRWLNAEDTKYVAEWLETFDAQKATAMCTADQATGYEGEPLHEIGMLDYVVSHIAGIGQFLAKHREDEDALLLVTG